MNRFARDVFICVDLETTGLDLQKDRIIEVGIAKFNLDGIIETFETLVDPEVLISEESQAIHHITDDMVKGQPKIIEVLPKILEMIGTHIIVGHGIRFDIQMLTNAAVKENLPVKIQHNRYIDTLRMARLYGDSPTNSLEQLRKHFNVEEEGAHRAMNDVIVNVHVFRHLLRNYKSLNDLFDHLSRPILMKTMPLGKHKGRPIKELPQDYLFWAANKDFDEDLLFSLRSEIKRRKKGNLFTQASNPFKDLDF